MYASDALVLHILGLFCGTAWERTYRADKSLYVELSTTAPSSDGTNVTPPTYTEYSRASALFSVSLDTAYGYVAKNADSIVFPTASTQGGTVTHVAIYSAPTGGEMLFYGALTTSVEVVPGVSVAVGAEELKLWISGVTQTFSLMLLTLIAEYTNADVASPSLYPCKAALFNGNPEAGGTEMTGGGYERVAVTFGEPALSGTQYAIRNTQAVVFPTATSSRGAYDYDVLCSTAGDVLLAKGGTVGSYSLGSQVQYAVGAITFALS